MTLYTPPYTPTTPLPPRPHTPSDSHKHSLSNTPTFLQETHTHTHSLLSESLEEKILTGVKEEEDEEEEEVKTKGSRIDTA